MGLELQNSANLQAPASERTVVPRSFWIVYGCFHVLGLTSIALVGAWIGKYEGGFSWRHSNPNTQFNYHPLFMTIGLIYLNAEAALFYRIFRNQKKIIIKQLHAVLQAVVFILMVTATKAAFDSHDLREIPIPNLYSLHSWIGLCTIVLFTFQLVLGFISFLFPMLNERFRSLYLPIHVFFGTGILILAIATALIGVTEKLIFTLGETNPYSNLPPKAVLGNVYGIVIVLFGITTVYLLVNSSYKRPPEMSGIEIISSIRRQSKYTVTSDFKNAQ